MEARCGEAEVSAARPGVRRVGCSAKLLSCAVVSWRCRDVVICRHLKLQNQLQGNFMPENLMSTRVLTTCLP